EGMGGMPGLGFGGAGMGGMGSGGAGAAGGVWSSFKGSLTTDLLTEEFGPAPGAPLGGMMGSMMSGGEDDYSDGGVGFGSSGSTGAEEDADTTADRYVHYGDELPYKTRAFILSVRMIQKDIPSLLASLPNGKFPVEIVRVDVDFTGGSGSSSGGGMSGMGGMGEGEGEGYGGGMTGGFGGGMGGLGGPGMGGLGMGSPGLGGPGMGRGGLGGGFGAPGKGKTRTRKEMKRATDGMRVFEDAMKVPLATVRVAGLMTIYESTEEKAAEAEADNAAETEVNDSAEGLPELDLDPGNTGTDPPTAETGDGAGSDATGTATSESETIDLDSPPSEGTNGNSINQNGADANGGGGADGSNGESMELPPANTPNESGTNLGNDPGNTELPKPGAQSSLRQNLDFKSLLG
ncbi:MAG: hypothetical protein ABJZ55_10455, partial [Fuerstiella sp.]